MGLLSDFFVADSASMPDSPGTDGLEGVDRCRFRGITPLEAGQFLAVLRGQEYSVELIREFRLLTPQDADDWTMSVPQDMVTALAEIEESDITGVAGRFADATRGELGWSPEDFEPVVSSLSALARRAIATGRGMYLWNSL